MNFGQAIKQYWTNYANFKGRTSKAGYWWAVLFTVLASIAVAIVFPDTHQYMPMDMNDWMDDRETWVDSPMQNLWSLATFLPSLAILVRRLHDTNRSGKKAWYLLIPIAGLIMVLIWTLQDGDKESNQYGDIVA